MAHWPLSVKNMHTLSLCFLVYCFMDLHISNAARSSEVIISAKAGEACDMKQDVLLVEDTSTEHGYLQCRPAGRGIIGFWERMSCQPGQKFSFTDQKCGANPHQKSKNTTVATQQLTSQLTSTLVHSTTTPTVTTTPTSTTTTTTVTITTTTPTVPIRTTTTAARVTTPEFIPQSTKAYIPRTTTAEEAPETTAADVTEETTKPIVLAFLQDSCANDEQCEGVTICHETLKQCLCPSGYAINSETKSCDVEQFVSEVESEPSTTEEPQADTTTAKYTIALEFFTQQTIKQISPGSSCKTTDAICGGGSYCNSDNRVCTCPLGTVDEFGVCNLIKISAGLNDKCDEHTKCAGWSTCINHVCRCQPPLVQQGHQCVPAEQQTNKKESRPGQPCNAGQHCLGGSVCSTLTLVCTCPQGFQDIGHVCTLNKHEDLKIEIPDETQDGRKKLAVNQKCDDNSACTSGSFCSASTTPPSCQCLANHIAIKDECLKIFAPGHTGCYFDEQCSASYQGAFCLTGVCACPNGLTAQANTCRPVALKPGENCKHNEECSGGATCFRNICVCPLGFAAYKGSCTEKSLILTRELTIGSFCSNSSFEVCQGNSQCINRTCQCFSGESFVNGTCTRSDLHSSNEALLFPLEKYLGIFLNYSQIETISYGSTRQCRSNSSNDCPPNENCIEGTCECFDGLSRSNGECKLKFSRAGDSCLKKEICLGEANCQYGLCTCLPGFKNEAGTCVPNKGVRVICPKGATLVDNVCENMNHEGNAVETYCSDARQCGRGFACLNHKCACPPGMIHKLGQCWRQPGGSCANGEVCDGCSVCIRHVCTCSRNVAPVAGVCPGNVARPNERCNSGQCCIGSSECVQGICTCPKDTMLFGQECKSIDEATSLPFGSCLRGETCIGNSSCHNGICVCAPEQIVLGNACRELSERKRLPGESCKTVVDQCTGGSSCYQGNCICAKGQIVINNVCVQNAPGVPGDFCKDASSCSIGLLCLSNQCQCPPNHQWSSDKCLPGVETLLPGDTCYSDKTFLCGAGSSCKNGKCVCSENQVIVKKQCRLQFVPPNHECESPQICLGNSQCLEGYCMCPSNTIPAGNLCLLIFPQPGEACSEELSQCTGGSSCLLGYCICPQGQQSLNGICSSKSTSHPGQFCEPNVHQCLGGSNCINHVCTCSDGSIIINAQCKSKLVMPNSQCQPQQQCHGGSQCLEGICLCPANFVVSANGLCISVSPGPGELCDANFSVCHGGSACIESKCTCPSGQKPYKDTCTSAGSVLIPTKPNEPCESEVNQCTGGSSCMYGKCTCPSDNIVVDGISCQVGNPYPFQSCNPGQTCAGGSICVEGVCLCPSNMLAINNVCQITPGPGEACNAEMPICNGGATCVNGICVCPQLNKPIDGKCNSAKPGEFCSADSYRCLDGSICTLDNICVCPNGSIIIDKKCMDRMIDPGNICYSQQTCGGGSVCITGICQCPTGFVSGPNKKCVPAVTFPGPNDPCGQRQTCTGGSSCLNGFCQCPINEVVIKGVCQSNLMIPGPGDPCKTGQICRGNANCLNGICVCAVNKVSKNGICEDVSPNNLPSGSSCTNDRQCGGGTSCAVGKCTCPASTLVYSSQCIPRQVNAGESCVMFVQACSGGSRCLAKLCVCPQGQSAIDGICKGLGPNPYKQSFVSFDQEETAKPGESCSSSQICVGGSNCINEVCLCPKGFHPAGENCIFVAQNNKAPGSWCSDFQQCTGNSICINNVCVCPQETIVVDGQCITKTTNIQEGGACITTNQCVNGLKCLVGFCQCLNGTICQGTGHFSSPPGGSCAALQRCSGGSVCRGGWCVCPNASMVVSNGVCALPSSDASLITTTLLPQPGEDLLDEDEDENDLDTEQPSSFVQFPMNPYPASNIFNQPQLGQGNQEPQRTFNTGSQTNQQPQQNFNLGSQNQNQPQQTFNLPSFVVPQNSFGGIMTSSNFFGQPVVDMTNIVGSNNSNFDVTQNNSFRGEKQLTRPGAPCGPASLCIGGSRCILGMCICEDQFEAVGQICIRRVPPIAASPPLGSCRNGEPCTGGSMCDGQICQCLPGTELRINLCVAASQQSSNIMPNIMQANRPPSNSIVVVPPLATCANGERCGGKSVCNRMSLICECPGNTQPVQGHCTVVFINKNRIPEQNRQDNPLISPLQSPTFVSSPNANSEPFKPSFLTEIGQDKSKPLNFNQNQFSMLPTLTNVNNMNSFNKQNLNSIPSISPLPQNQFMFVTGVPNMQQVPNMQPMQPMVAVGSLEEVEPSTTKKFDIASPPNAPCGQGRVCTGGSFCVNHRCRCPEGSVVNEFDMCQQTMSPSISSKPSTLGGKCSAEQACAGIALCISNRCRCPPGTMQDGPVCISLKDSGKPRYFSASVAMADTTSLCPKGVEPIKESDGENYVQCNASRPSICPWGWYCYATDKATEGPYFCCPV